MATLRAGRLLRTSLAIAQSEHAEQVLALGMRITSAALGYLIIACAARVLPVEGFSDFALMLAIAAMFGALGTLGQETWLLRTLPVLCADAMRGYRHALRRSGSVTLAGLALFAGLAALYGGISFQASAPILLVLIALLVLASGTADYLFAVQRGSGSVLGAVFAREIAWKVVLAAAIAGFLLAGTIASITTLAACYLLGMVATIAISSAFVTRRWLAAPQTGSASSERGGAFSYFLLNLIGQAGTQLDVIILGAMAFVNPVQLGAFYAAQRTIQVLYILPYGASITSAPRVPMAWRAGNLREITRLSRQISRGIAGIIFLIFLALLAFRSEIMNLFKPEFVEFGFLLPLLAVAPLASASGGLHNIVPAMCGLEKQYSALRLTTILVFFLVKMAAALDQSLMFFVLASVAEGLVVPLLGVLLVRIRLKFWIL